MSSYAKFLNDMSIIKRCNNVQKNAFLIEQISALFHLEIPLKYKDSKCLTISCVIG